MYLQNKYTYWYYSIIDKARSRTIAGYFEKHHIVPKCLGGNDTEENLINLTPKEHFLCHWLLTKMVLESPEQKNYFMHFRPCV